MASPKALLRRRLQLIAFFLLTLPACAVAQDTTRVQLVRVKNNLLYDATLTPNLGVEWRMDSLNSIQLFYGINPWTFSQRRQWRHWSLMPEWRRWFSTPFLGHFVGIHAVGGEYRSENIGPFTTLKHNHYEGWYVGGGLTYGYSWRLSTHWQMEAAIGVGYLYSEYDRYAPGRCGEYLGPGHKHYVGPTKLALNIAYVFDRKKITPPVEIIEPVVLPVTAAVAYQPQWIYGFVTPQAEAEKVREYSGKAFLDFPVNKTDIRPDFRRNAEELAKVVQTIDVVRLDSNATITDVTIHGYASPEGSYENNARLAEGRAQAFAAYIRQLISLPESRMHVASTPEDWDGLKKFVENLPPSTPNTPSSPKSPSPLSSLLPPSPQSTLLFDPSLSPDARERQFRSRYPREWAALVADVFPALRHSDYVVQYAVRPFTTGEAREIIRQKPQQLSLNEMFLVAQSYPEGSADFVETFETAVRLFPADPTANLNAAVAALQRGDLDAASRHIARAGSSPEALTAAAILAARLGQNDRARELFTQAVNEAPEGSDAAQLAKANQAEFERAEGNKKN